MQQRQGFIGREYAPIYNNTKILIKYQIDVRNPLFIDFSRKEHTFIVAKSGSGKSYLAGVFAEEAIRCMDNYAVIILDPMGIFSTLSKPGDEFEIRKWNNQLPQGNPDVIPEGLENIKVWIPAGDEVHFDPDMYDGVFSLKAKQFTYGTLCYAFDLDILDPQTNLFRKAQGLLQQQEYTLADLKAKIMEEYDNLHFKPQTSEALLAKLDALEELHLITDRGIDLHEMIQEQEVVVFDLSMASSYTAKIIINFLAEQLLQRRKMITKKLLKAQEKQTLIEIPNYIPPTLLIIDEAHNYLPNNSILKKLIKEGRNVGCMLTAISQSPDLTKDVYANITHLFVGQLNFDDDIMAIKGMLPLEKTPKDLRKEIKELDVGCFYYYNMNSKLEKRIRVRPRRTMHPASTELKNERQYLLNKQLKNERQDLERQLITLLEEEGGSLPMAEIPEELQSMIKPLIEAHKLKIDEQEDQTIVQL